MSLNQKVSREEYIQYSIGIGSCILTWFAVGRLKSYIDPDWIVTAAYLITASLALIPEFKTQRKSERNEYVRSALLGHALPLIFYVIVGNASRLT